MDVQGFKIVKNNFKQFRVKGLNSGLNTLDAFNCLGFDVSSALCYN